MQKKPFIKLKEKKKREENKAILKAKRHDPSTEEYLKYNWDYKVYGENDIVLLKYLGTDTNVVVPENICGYKVIGIANGAFSPQTGRRDFLMKKLESVSLPDSVCTMGANVFYDCRNLSSVHLPHNLSVIPEYTFFRCIKLTSIDIPTSVVRIEKYAFLIAVCYQIQYCLKNYNL